MTEAVSSDSDVQLVEAIVERITTDLAAIIDRPIEIQSVEVERATARPAGQAQVHVSFKLGFEGPAGRKQGCVLVPLPDAIALASYLMMFPDDAVASKRALDSLDSTTKDAMLELGTFASTAVEEALHGAGLDVTVRSDGCQGVRADVRPALEYRDGEVLLVGRAIARLHDFPPFPMLVLIPEIA